MANVTTQSFNGDPFPPEVVGEILNLGLSGAPVFDTLTRRLTTRGSLVFPTGTPDGFDWTPELGLIPSVDPHADSAAVAVAKIAGQLLLSNESIADTEANLTEEVGRMIYDGMAAKVDTDCVYGDPANTAAPVGIFAALDLVEAVTLRAAVIEAAAAIMGNGGTPTNVILSPALWAAEVDRRETTQTANAPLFADLGIPLEVKVAATLKPTDALVLDKAGCFGIVNTDYTIEASSEAADAWNRDGVSLRVKARVTAAVPAPAKHARALAVGD